MGQTPQMFPSKMALAYDLILARKESLSVSMSLSASTTASVIVAKIASGAGGCAFVK